MQTEDNIKSLLRDIIMEVGVLQADINNLEKQLINEGQRINYNCDYIQSRYQRINCLEYGRKKLEWVLGFK